MKSHLTRVAALACATIAILPVQAATMRIVEVLTTPARTELLERIVSDFEAAHPGVEVELISIPWDTAYERLLAMSLSGEQIDVIEMPELWVSTLAANKGIIDLGPYIDNWDGRSDITDATYEFSKLYNNTSYFMPYGYFVNALFYHKGLLAGAGFSEPPKTMDELDMMARRISKIPGKYGYCLRGGRGGLQGWWLLISAETGAGPWWDEDGNSIFDTPGAIKAIQQMIDLYNDGVAPPDSLNWAFNETVAGFYSGNCAFLNQDPDALIQIRENMADDDFGVAPHPLGRHGRITPMFGMIGWSIASTAADKDLAWEFVAAMTEPQVNVAWAKFLGIPPAVHLPANDPFYNDPLFDAFFTELENPEWDLLPWPAYLPGFSEFNDVLSVQTSQQALLGELTAEELGKTWADYMNKSYRDWKASQ